MWYSVYTVGDVDIDQEHANIDFMLSSLKNKSPELQVSLIRLIDVIILHFVNEEKIAQERGYAMTSEHIETHRKLTSQLAMIKSSLEVGDVDPDIIPGTLQEILKLHILEYDRFLCAPLPS